MTVSGSPGRSTGSTSIPFSARGIVQDYKSGKGAHSARDIDRELRLQIPLYMLALRDLVGVEPLGGVYRALAGRRLTRGMLRESARDDLPGFARGRLPRRGHVLGAGRVRARARRRERAADPARATSSTTPRATGARRGAISGRSAGCNGHDGRRDDHRAQRRAAGCGRGRRARSSSPPERARGRRRFSSSATSARCASAASTSTRSSSSRTRARRPASCASRIRAALRERGRPDLARELDGAWISTIHGFCSRLLRAHPFAAGLDPRFRELEDAGAAVLRGEAFERALEEFCADGEPERLRLLATYRADGLRRMLTGVYETLRSAGRELVLELGERPSLAARAAELRAEAERLAADASATATQQAERRPRSCALATEAIAASVSSISRRFACTGSARRVVRAGAQGRRAGGARGARRPRSRSPPGASRALRRRVRGREAARVGRRLRGSPARGARPAPRRRRGPRGDAAPLPHGHGRRVPGHEPAAVRARRPRRTPGTDRGLHGRRRVPVDLRLPPRGPRGLPRASRAGAEPARAHAATTAHARRCSRP